MARYKKRVIKREDTIESIAQQELGNALYWDTIVEYNELRYPYIVDTTEEKERDPIGLVTVGDSILIPVEQNLLDIDVDSISDNDRNLILDLSLGSDLSVMGGDKVYKYDGTRDEIFEMEGGGRGDVQLSKGAENIKQATIARLLTRRGSLLLHPEYGSELHTLIGEPTNSMTLELVDNEILRTIQKDGRVAEAKRRHSKIDKEIYTGEFDIYVYPLEEMFELLIETEGEGFMIT